MSTHSPRLFSRVRNWPKLAVIFLIGVAGLKLLDIELSSTHPIITAAVLNLSPFWAALIAFLVSRRTMSVSPFAFTCFLVAFFGAMAIAWSQIDLDSKVLARGCDRELHPQQMDLRVADAGVLCFEQILVYQWFSDFDEPAAIAANFIVSSLVLIPLAVVTSDFGRASNLSEQSAVAILLLLVGTLAASAGTRLFYQMALTATKNDNGYVTMFFLLIPALSALISFMLSHWIPGLRFVPRPMFFVGMAVVTIPLLALSWASWRDSQPRGSVFGKDAGR